MTIWFTIGIAAILLWTGRGLGERERRWVMGMLLLALGQCRMALLANCCSNVIVPRRIPFTRPPTRFCKVFLASHLIRGSYRHLGRDRYLEKNRD